MGGNVEEEDWVGKLSVAPTYYPTDSEFADPIAYISKIEKEASGFGICKVVPPLPKPSKRFVFSNLNKSLVKFPETTTPSTSDPRPVFTTRHQQLGSTNKSSSSSSGVHNKQVWQSGALYTLDQFESKAKAFAKTQLGAGAGAAVESLFWKAASQSPPIYIEYANDVPGSGFGEPQNYHNTPPPPRMMKKNEFDGTAGWKLSNSPWNLQLIARSPGSLTRFMLDDIPGVTSPMIYIGMLFSWFAWHVEDHELHSLNFLHFGSPKTWYAVPAHHALPFEELIRAKAYGGNLDHLASLSLLGEKTNLLSPDVVISTGIPCCRLVQNPGEFVVTFPRAYHIGFSHGFNCGEAANFGTPQWLKVAKAAAVRRAAMDYLPMLSHQQLLYMLTMSFISRVPKALLSRGRTSRLKDRQKEERELLVKKACIDDMLKEKQLLSVLLGKESSFYAVLWDPEALPSSDCGSQEPSILSPMPLGRQCGGFRDGDRCSGDANSEQMSMETLQEFYGDEDDLPCGLHVDSGTLPCVACGVLGFPFMSIVQPCKKASEELFPVNCQVSKELELGPKETNVPSSLYDAALKSASEGHNFVQNQNISQTCRRNLVATENSLWKVYREAISTSPEATETRNFKETASLPCSPNVESNCSMIHCIDGHPPLPKGQLLHSTNDSPNKWNTSNEFLRPRVFCLEHAIQIEELLRSKGGANILILCHSAYPKIKAHALAVAEELGAPFDCTEVPLARASKEDIDLITISMDGDGHEEGREDWTARLGLNLRYCVKLRKLSPPQDEQHILPLGGLFADTFFELDYSSIKWKSRRTRTPYKIVGPRRSKFFRSCQTEKGDGSVEKMEKIDPTRENKVMQYSRRKSNRKAVLALQAHSEHRDGKHPHEDTCKSNLVTGLVVEMLSSIKYDGNNKHSSGVQGKKCSSEHSTQVNEIVYPPRSAAGSLSSESTENEVSQLAISSHGDGSELQHDKCSKVDNKEKGEIVDTINGAHTEKYSHELGSLPYPISVAAGIREAFKEEGDQLGISDPANLLGSKTKVWSPRNVEEDENELHDPSSSVRALEEGGKRKDVAEEKSSSCNGFIKSPCEGLRPRRSRVSSIDADVVGSTSRVRKKAKKGGSSSQVKDAHQCDIERCGMSFKTREQLMRHKRNRCTHKGCGKQFRSHKYAVLHQRVHADERPLKCPWKGCKMTFKWAWARTEHVRLHTGERPYCCKTDGCGLTFRFVSDFSRHRRKSGHHAEELSL